jgi:hypothetical protein
VITISGSWRSLTAGEALFFLVVLVLGSVLYFDFRRGRGRFSSVEAAGNGASSSASETKNDAKSTASEPMWVRDAIARESQLKEWSRATKIRLINRLNSRWADFGSEVLQEP